ncbi:MAG: UDP-N-acetylmuramate--L-alanine ligase [Planctomycetes bacterium]|nr:UDP-N-acetylmuramate--L-alanine ligase [Planctomycetota bacterium]
MGALPERIHAVGVGGGGMDPLVRLLAFRGHRLSGSDRGTARDDLRAAGVHVHTGHDAAHLGDAQLVVRSAAVPDDNPEVAAARARGLPVLKYSQALGALMAERVGVGVAGTHGKTTTTSLLAHLLRAAGRDPSWIVGGRPLSLPAAWGWGEGQAFVAEACEYDHSFLDLPLRVAVVTGVAVDHLECFGDEDGVRRAFGRFVAQLPDGGVLVPGDHVPSRVLDALPAGARLLRPDEVSRLDDVRTVPEGFAGRIVRPGGGASRPFRLRRFAAHDLMHLRCALAAASALDCDPLELAEAVDGYLGVARRLHDLGERPLVAGGDVRLIDDFAHHPEAVAAAAEAIGPRFPGRRLVACFQPHQVCRTEDLLDEFVGALARFDRVALCDIFVARDRRPERAGPVTTELSDALGDRSRRVGPAASADEAVRDLLRPGDVCVVMGAGDVEGLARRLAGAPARP